MLWILIGGIFFGAVHDYGALFASIRHKGQTLGEVVAANIGERAKKLFIIFSYLTLVLVVAAFASIVAGTFKGFNDDGTQNAANASVAMVSILFIVMAIILGGPGVDSAPAPGLPQLLPAVRHDDYRLCGCAWRRHHGPEHRFGDSHVH